MTLYLDFETTGIDPALNEILQIGIVDDNGDILLDTLVRPQRLRTWPDAERVHGITPVMVEKAPQKHYLQRFINYLVYDQDVVIYNATFDLGFMPSISSTAKEIHCCMLAYAEFRQVWDENRKHWKWFKLADAAAAIGYEWQGEAHRAVADCLATRAVWQFLQANKDKRMYVPSSA